LNLFLFQQQPRYNLALVATFAKQGKQTLLGLAAISNADDDDVKIQKENTKRQDDDQDEDEDEDDDDDEDVVDERSAMDGDNDVAVSCVLSETMRSRMLTLLNKCVSCTPHHCSFSESCLFVFFFGFLLLSISVRYFEKAAKILVERFKQLNKLLKSNDNLIVMKGSLPEARLKQTEQFKTYSVIIIITIIIFRL